MVSSVWQDCLKWLVSFHQIIQNYSTLPDVQVKQGVIKAFRHILSKKVVM